MTQILFNWTFIRKPGFVKVFTPNRNRPELNDDHWAMSAMGYISTAKGVIYKPKQVHEIVKCG
jgi:hypothetical protein